MLLMRLMLLLGEGYSHAVRLQTFRERVAAGNGLPLALLLVLARNCLTTDPRDKVFALLGIGSDVELVGEDVKF